MFHNVEDCSFKILIHEEVKIITALSSEDGHACERKSLKSINITTRFEIR